MKARARNVIMCVSAMIILASGLWGRATDVVAVPPRTHCVGATAGCYPTVQAAVDAAHDGDRLVLSPGVFSGGITIDKSVQLVGSGSASTIIRGGGPVVTIGRLDAPRQPTVLIEGVTITGGVTRSSPLSAVITGKAGVLALGGGIAIPPAAHFGDGATVRIRDSLITHNRVEPTATVPSGASCADQCPFALAGGGGIDSWGTLTLTGTSVSDNVTGGPLASDSVGAGVYSEQGSLTLIHSRVTANRASATRPNGRFAEGGGIVALSRPFYVDAPRSAGVLTINQSRVARNTASLVAAFPSSTEGHASSGGLLVGGDDDCSQPGSGCVRASITGSSFQRNRVRASNAFGDATAFSGGLNNDGVLALRDAAITDNRVTARVPVNGGRAGASADSGGLGMGGYATIEGSRLVGNVVTAAAGDGQASASFAGMSSGDPSHLTSVDHGVIAENRLAATTRGGEAVVQGAGVGHLGGPLLIERTIIRGNQGNADGPDGLAQGGGIANLADATAPLTLERSLIAQNSVRAGDPAHAQGGGLYTRVPVERGRTMLSRNRPDQCFGACS